MEKLQKPQIICHQQQTLNYAVHDVKWIPCSSKFVAVGGKSNGSGIVEIYSLTGEGIEKKSDFGKKEHFKCCTFDASSLRNRHLATGDFCGRLQVWDLEDTLVPVYKSTVHKAVINAIDGVSGNNSGCGAPEIATASRDGSVLVWDVRQKEMPVAKFVAAEESSARDCWSVAFGDSYNNEERVLAAGYDNGDIKIFDLKNMKVRWSKCVKNGVVGLQFDRKSIPMNKLVATTLESKIYCFDVRTQHPKKGFAYVTEKAHDSTVWTVRHLPQNREIFMTTGGSGSLCLWKYNYPLKRVEKDSDGLSYGVAGELNLIQNCTLTEQPITSFDCHGQAINNRYFPESLKMGVANAAPQIEGAWNEGGKGETIWDRFAMSRPARIVDRSTPEVACDSYHLWREDLRIIKGMGAQFYRLSIAWARILPNGYFSKDAVNPEGVKYYKTLLRELKKMNIEPLVTLYHWDLPQKLQNDMGGWLNPKTADIFAEYARLCFELFGDEVKWWITINEPKQVCEAGYGTGGFAPGIRQAGVGDYICAKNVLLAHAKAYRIYDKEFREKNQGKVAMVIDTLWFEPGIQSPEDVAAAERALQFMYGLYGHPIYFGDWPQIVKDRVALRSRGEGLKQSRLPEFTPEEKKLINGTHDYLTINYYATHMASAIGESPYTHRSFYDDMNIIEWINPAWPKGGPRWFSIWPTGLRKVLNWMKNTYGDHEIVITENGLSDNTGVIEDPHRTKYIRDHLSACLDAIYEDKVRLVGYMAWSFMDDWEWTGGFASRIGMHHVDFNSPNKTRTPRASALYYRMVCNNRCLVDKCV